MASRVLIRACNENIHTYAGDVELKFLTVFQTTEMLRFKDFLLSL